jgi:hypothetical protein
MTHKTLIVRPGDSFDLVLPDGMCRCSLCRAREQNRHPWELYFEGRPLTQARIHADWLRNDLRPIYYYDDYERLHQPNGDYQI